MRLFKNFQLVDFATIIFAVFIFVPQVKALGIPSPWFIGLAVWMVAFILNKRARAYFLKRKFLRYIVLLWAFVLLITAFEGEMTIVNRYASMLCIPFSYIIYDFNKFQNKKDVNIKLFVVISLIAFVPVLPTIYALQVSPSAVRAIKTAGEESTGAALLGIGDYSTIYSSVILTLLYTVIFLEAKALFKNELVIKTFVVFFELLFLVMIVMSNYFTALALTVGGQVALFLFVKYRKSVYFIIPLFIIYGFFSKPINLFIIDNSLLLLDSSGKNYARLAVLRSNIQNGTHDDEGLNTREDTNERAIEIITTYPIQGAILSGNFRLSNMGQHSTVLDTWGFYGIFIGSLLNAAFILPLLFIYRKQSNYHSRISVLIVSGIYLVITSANNLTPHISFMAFFMMPSLMDKINNKLDKKYTMV